MSKSRTLCDLLRMDSQEREAEREREADRQEAEFERDNEKAYERHLENLGWMDAQGEREWEDSRGVIQFEDAMDAALGRNRE